MHWPRPWCSVQFAGLRLDQPQPTTTLTHFIFKVYKGGYRISLRVLRDFEKGKKCQKAEKRGSFLDRAKAEEKEIGGKNGFFLDFILKFL